MYTIALRMISSATYGYKKMAQDFFLLPQKNYAIIYSMTELEKNLWLIKHPWLFDKDHKILNAFNKLSKDYKSKVNGFYTMFYDIEAEMYSYVFTVSEEDGFLVRVYE